MGALVLPAGWYYFLPVRAQPALVQVMLAVTPEGGTGLIFSLQRKK